MRGRRTYIGDKICDFVAKIYIVKKTASLYIKATFRA